MNKRETVQALTDSIQKGDFENACTMLADDFQFSGPVPEPINKETWLGRFQPVEPSCEYDVLMERYADGRWR